jgi:hypothetical protein
MLQFGGVGENSLSHAAQMSFRIFHFLMPYYIANLQLSPHFGRPELRLTIFHWRRFFAGSWTNQHTQVMYLLYRVTGTVLSDFVRVIFKVVVTRCGP